MALPAATLSVTQTSDNMRMVFHSRAALQSSTAMNLVHWGNEWGAPGLIVATSGGDKAFVWASGDGSLLLV